MSSIPPGRPSRADVGIVCAADDAIGLVVPEHELEARKLVPKLRPVHDGDVRVVEELRPDLADLLDPRHEVRALFVGDELHAWPLYVRPRSSRISSPQTKGATMEVGPVDVYIIGFPGNKFSGKIAPAIKELVDDGTIRILDLLFVMKDEEGVVTTLAIEDLDQDGAAFAELDITEPGSLNEEDAEEVSDDLPANSSALLVAFENLWAAKVVSALADADAVLIDSIRIPAEVVAQARAEA
jgi:uncharacterized membrane protein